MTTLSENVLSPETKRRRVWWGSGRLVSDTGFSILVSLSFLKALLQSLSQGPAVCCRDYSTWRDVTWRRPSARISTQYMIIGVGAVVRRQILLLALPENNQFDLTELAASLSSERPVIGSVSNSLSATSILMCDTRISLQKQQFISVLESRKAICCDIFIMNSSIQLQNVHHFVLRDNFQIPFNILIIFLID